MIILDAVGGDGVGRPLHHDRILPARVLGDVDHGEELRPVPHRDPVLLLDVVGLGVLELLLGEVACTALLGQEGARGEDEQAQDERYRQAPAT